MRFICAFFFQSLAKVPFIWIFVRVTEFITRVLMGILKHQFSIDIVGGGGEGGFN
jgi:hypothetical protein